MSRAVCASRITVILAAFAVATPATAQTVFEPPAFGSLFKDTITDFRRLPSLETAAILAIGAAVATVGHQADGPATLRMSGSKDLGEFLDAGKTIGGARAHLASALATYAIGRTMGNGRVTAAGADLIRANIVAQTMTSTLKLSVRRTRPDGAQYSFPSGHTSTSFAAATVLHRHFGWKAGVPAYAVAGYVAGSRVQDKRHYLSDVAFGAAIGIVAGRTATLDIGKRHFIVTPQATAEGAGVNLSWK